MAKIGRYHVEHIHLDGNPYEDGVFDSLADAQACGRKVRQQDEIKRLRLPVVVTDTDDPERGNLIDADVTDDDDDVAEDYRHGERGCS